MMSGRGRGVLSALVTVILAGGALLALHQPRYEEITLASGHRFDVLSVARNGGVARMLRDTALSRREAVVVDYYTREADLDSPSAFREAYELTEVAIPVARRMHDSLIVTRPIANIGPRWSPFIKGRLHFFVPARDGDWQEIIP